MPRPRLRFREFLLLITLGSLIAAACAVRARTAHDAFFDEQDYRAHRARAVASSWEDAVDQAKQTLEALRAIPADSAARCDV
jgi:hypothetical protein